MSTNSSKQCPNNNYHHPPTPDRYHIPLLWIPGWDRHHGQDSVHDSRSRMQRF